MKNKHPRRYITHGRRCLFCKAFVKKHGVGFGVRVDTFLSQYTWLSYWKCWNCVGRKDIFATERILMALEEIDQLELGEKFP